MSDFDASTFGACRDCGEQFIPGHLDVFGRCEDCQAKYEERQGVRRNLIERFKDILEEWDLPRDGYGVLAEKLVDEAMSMEGIDDDR